MVAVPNDLRTLRSTVSSLEEAGLTVLVFGGWAEELQGMVAARAHHEIDLLVLDPTCLSLMSSLAQPWRYFRNAQVTSGASR
jgi:hypothetical protein